MLLRSQPHLPSLGGLLLAMTLVTCTGVAQADNATTLALQQSPLLSSNDASSGGAYTPADSEAMWLPLKHKHFGERPLLEGATSRISLVAPERAEDDAAVPVQIKLQAASRPQDRFKQLYLVVDVNPAPLGGLFRLMPDRPLEQLNTQVRVNGYTYIRAIGETADGTLHMAKQWVKSTGAGCSAPPDTDQAEHQKRLGKMRIKLPDSNALQDKDLLRLVISHPNNTGMQRNQLTTLLIPEHYVEQIKISFQDQVLLEATTSFTLSENPSFSFNFAPTESGLLQAEVRDNRGQRFIESLPIRNPG